MLLTARGSSGPWLDVELGIDAGQQEGCSMYAIVETGGRQYRVEAGQSIDVEKLPAVVGDSVTLDRVLLVADGNRVTVGNPTVDGASVQATVVAQAKSRKAIIFKYMPKERYRRRKSHRQLFSRLTIDSIEL